MYEVSQNWKTAIAADARDLRAQIAVNESVVLTDEVEISTVKIERLCNTEERFFGNAVSAKLECEMYESEQTTALVDGDKVQVSFFINSLPEERVSFAPMDVLKITKDPDAGTFKMTAQDALCKADAEQISKLGEITYPITLKEYAAAVAALCGIELSENEWYHSDLVLPAAPNLSGTEKVREVIAWIAEAAFCNAVIDRSGKLAFVDARGLSAEAYPIDTQQYYKVDISSLSGPYNTLVLARLPQEDNIYRENTEAVAENGRIEVKIADNPFLDGMREDVIDEMCAAISDVAFYAAVLEWRGDPSLDMGDWIIIEDNDGKQYRTFYGSEKLEFDGGLRCKAETKALTKTETAYRKAASTREIVRKTQLAVDKLKGEIAGVVSEVSNTNGRIDTLQSTFEATSEDIELRVSKQQEELDEVTGEVESAKEQVAELQITVESISAQTQTRGGANLLKGTAAYDLDSWNASEGVSLTRGSEYDTDVRRNSASQGGFLLGSGAALSQTIPTISSGQYCFMLRYKLVGSGATDGSITFGGTEVVLSPSEEWRQIKGNITAVDTAVGFAVNCTVGFLLVADLIVMPGLEVTAWQQAQNEITTDDMRFANGVLTIGREQDPLQSNLDNSSWAVKNTASGENELYISPKGTELGQTHIRKALTVDSDARKKGLVISPLGDGHILFTIND